MSENQNKGKAVLPPTYFMTAIVLSILLHFVLPLIQLIQFPWRWLGVLFLVVGIILNLWPDQLLKKYQTTVKPFEISSVLVTDGAYAFSRNPMYLGMVALLLGLAFLLGSIPPFLITILFAGIMHYRFILPEEKMLEQTFAEEFTRYREKVRRWL